MGCADSIVLYTLLRVMYKYIKLVSFSLLSVFGTSLVFNLSTLVTLPCLCISHLFPPTLMFYPPEVSRRDSINMKVFDFSSQHFTGTGSFSKLCLCSVGIKVTKYLEERNIKHQTEMYKKLRTWLYAAFLN